MKLFSQESEPPSVPQVNDDLLDCLLYLSQHYERPSSRAALSSGLPLVDGKLTLELFSKAAARAYLSATVHEAPLEDVLKSKIPFILILGEKAAIVLNVKDDEISAVIPSESESPQFIQKEELERDYSGQFIAIAPRPQMRPELQDQKQLFKKHWFWGTLSHFWPLYSQAIFASIFINLFTLAGTIFTLTVYDRVIPHAAFETLWVLVSGIVVVFIFDFILRGLRGYFVDTAGKNADILLSSMLFDRLMGIRMDKRPPSAGMLVNELREFESLREFMSSATLLALADLPFLFIFLGVIWVIGGMVVAVPFVVIPTVVAVTYFLQKPLETTTQLNLKQMGVRHALLIEAVQGVETIKGLGAEGKLQRQWESFLQENAETGLKSKLLNAKAVNFALLAQNLNNMGIVIVGAYEIAAHNMTMGALVACVILAGRAMTPISQLVGLMTRINQSKAALKKLNTIVNLPVDRPKGHQFLSKPHIEGAVEFKNVAFAYPEEETYALNNLSFKIKAGEKVALVGRIGSGKSTIEKLVMGFYPPYEGNVLIDGIDLRQIDPVDLRNNISYIPQDIFLFYGTIKDNISMGGLSLSDEEILKASQMVGAHDFIRKHPHGYGMRLGEGGSGLSGGQRQTIACARALTSKASIYLFDEPTAMMDSGSEMNFIQQLKQHTESKTLIIITHRPPLLALVDRIIVIDRGGVVADGPKDQVLQALAQGQISQGAQA
ncbi:type I secretion system permease/ATPase [Candidatus Bealeia paramacronuclearis]